MGHFVLRFIDPFAFDFAEPLFDRSSPFHATVADNVNRLDFLGPVFADGDFDFLHAFGSLLMLAAFAQQDDTVAVFEDFVFFDDHVLLLRFFQHHTVGVLLVDLLEKRLLFDR